MCQLARYVLKQNLNTADYLAFCNLYPSLRELGILLAWILLKVFLNLKALILY
jgi:hypothetical protein